MFSGLICILICFILLCACYHRQQLDKARESCQRPFYELQGLKQPQQQIETDKTLWYQSVNLYAIKTPHIPTSSMTALPRKRHPRGAEDRQGQQPERTIPQVEPATPLKNASVTQRGNKLTDI